MLPYFALALYIISLIASLILMITAKRKSASNQPAISYGFKAVVFVHLLFLLLFLIVRIGIINQERVSFLISFAFLIYFCSGTALCGWALRTSVPKWLKIYFALFNASLLLFIFMPFNFSIFLLSGGFNGSPEKSFPINDHYYITEQGSLNNQTEHPIYRVVKHNGMFNQTIQYNLDFNGMVDSIQVLNIINNKSATVRAYIKKSVSKTDIDSSDAQIKLEREPKNDIQRKI